MRYRRLVVDGGHVFIHIYMLHATPKLPQVSTHFHIQVPALKCVDL